LVPKYAFSLFQLSWVWSCSPFPAKSVDNKLINRYCHFNTECDDHTDDEHQYQYHSETLFFHLVIVIIL